MFTTKTVVSFFLLIGVFSSSTVLNESSFTFPPAGTLKFSVFLSSKTGICSGTLVSPQWVLTAAHCLHYNDSQRVIDSGVKVTAGVFDYQEFSSTRQDRRSQLIVVHPKYRWMTRAGNDLALVKVNETFNMSETVDVIKISQYPWPQNNGVFMELNCISSGFGSLVLVNLTNTRLKMWTSVALHGSDSCPCIKSSEWENLICLKEAEGVGLCRGDSGAPLVCDGSSHPSELQEFYSSNSLLDSNPSPLKLYGLAHFIVDDDVCLDMDADGSKTECGSRNTVNVYMYLYPYNEWIQSYLDEVPKSHDGFEGVHYYLSILRAVLVLLFLTVSFLLF